MSQSGWCVLLLAAGLARDARAQVYQFESPPPQATASNAAWQVNGEPVVHAGDVYLATPERVFFDGHVMVQVAVYLGVPIYADATLEPYSIVYIPVGNRLMRRYERRRAGPLAGTEGSRGPWFPVESPAVAPLTGAGRKETEATATTGSSSVAAIPAASLLPLPTARRDHGERVEPASRKSACTVWVEYAGARWYSAGPAVQLDSERFLEIGDDHGFRIFREKGRPDESRDVVPDAIYVETVSGGLLAPYDRR